MCTGPRKDNFTDSFHSRIAAPYVRLFVCLARPWVSLAVNEYVFKAVSQMLKYNLSVLTRSSRAMCSRSIPYRNIVFYYKNVVVDGQWCYDSD